MAPGSIKCSKCERTFSMPAHLARHMNTIHRRKGKAKTPRKVARAKKGPRRAKRKYMRRAAGAAKRRGRAAMSLGPESAHLVQQMRTHHDTLVSQRKALDAQIECIGRAIEAMGPAAPKRGARKLVRRGRRGRRGVRAGSLKDFIVRVLRQQGRPMSPRDIGLKVISAGFKTKAKDLTKAVSNTLPKMRGIKKVGFGLYQGGAV